MHELSLMKDLMAKIEKVARDNGGHKVVSVHLKVGELCHMSPDHLREHFVQASANTLAEGAKVTCEPIPGIDHPQAQDLILDQIELED